MSDLISRADAIEAIFKVGHEHVEEKVIPLGAVTDYSDAINALPSAETHEIRTETHGVCSDLISRADAIEAVGYEIDEGYNAIVGRINKLPSAEAVSMEEHIKELNDLAVEWKAKFAKAETITDEIYDETMAKVAKECEECKERLRNIRQSDEAVQGEWVRKYDDKVNCYWYECDQCGEYRPRNKFGHEYNANFCPNCGAKMHKGGEE